MDMFINNSACSPHLLSAPVSGLIVTRIAIVTQGSKPIPRVKDGL